MCGLQWYRNHSDRLDDVMSELDSSMRHEHDIQRAVNDFESQKLCYLPLTTFYLKPYQRLLHYQLLLESMTSYCVDAPLCCLCLSICLSVCPVGILTVIHQGAPVNISARQ